MRGGTVIGETLTVYSVLPHPERGPARDAVDGQRLALQQAGGRAGEFKITFASLDETGDGRDDSLPGRVASAMRQAIGDAQVVAVIADLEAETALVSIPLLNSAGILHVSPGVDDPRFTTGGPPGEPERFYPAGERTFFPVPTPATDVAFRRDFTAAFGRVPGPEAAAGRAAMLAVLEAVERAGADASRRQAVIDAYRSLD